MTSPECAIDALCAAWNALCNSNLNPFQNTGNKFHGKYCEVIAYEWQDEPFYEYNFKWRDFTASWYKHCSRGLECSRELTKEEIVEMINECTLDFLNLGE